SSRPRSAPSSPPFPYTTLFRSCLDPANQVLAQKQIATRSVLGGAHVVELRRDRLHHVRPSAAAAGDLLDGGDGDLVVRLEQERRSEEHMSELQSPYDLVCRLLL